MKCRGHKFWSTRAEAILSRPTLILELHEAYLFALLARGSVIYLLSHPCFMRMNVLGKKYTIVAVLHVDDALMHVQLISESYFSWSC